MGRRDEVWWRDGVGRRDGMGRRDGVGRIDWGGECGDSVWVEMESGDTSINLVLSTCISVSSSSDLYLRIVA